MSAPMADLRRFEMDELVNRPGTYVNPQTEVVIVVDDSATVDAELFADSADEGEWLLVSDDAPLDESRRDELLERLQRRAQRTSAPALDEDDDDEDDTGDDFTAAGFDDPAAYDDED
ncbi:MAG: hypothetical protein AVDCRST_MAG38-2259 [uncultured Solirubrobacteraceae bacterium]|uniref:Uncharacterized protein n=1 Tax=uncultured Solirubrobacteraceae bacterium TaxID=1162706 RepID=A0A6J4S7R7_9ACTN|nr:MAG: hypothetical protein AVDCRST_MAG38-2259 [uncultured Solirubrobacteraceae bacterium]